MISPFLDFEKPIADIYEQIQKVNEINSTTGVNVEKTILELEQKLLLTQQQIYTNLSPWQRVQLSRHHLRPQTLNYIEHICDNFTELHGDRSYGDDKAIITGFGTIEGDTYLIVGHQKGRDIKSRQYHNFGMANPEGYRKALRLMKLAEKFNKPIICFIDTPGAYPGLEAEMRGQAEAIAKNIYEMVQIKVPIVCIIIGEGASGGALGIGVGDKICMLENTWYSVISPESCSLILWRSTDFKTEAAAQLKLTATDMLHYNLIDDIIQEPLGGAHNNVEEVVKSVKTYLLNTIKELKQQPVEELLKNRWQKYIKIGQYFEN